ncbi:hypothetical protein [Candidatus Amarolinea aalborgensis]|uniref:hypothetical protein n=1 Tax=Candidatus Amarolinea aalborgensis TaxID=2249329 RepID=UPI003BF99DA6
MPDKATLIAPMRVVAIHQSQERAVVGPEMDFESLPYYDKQRGQDVNPDLPYLAESIASQPFEDANFILRAGVHLHWDFPQFLKRTKFRASDPTEFPAVPTRWLVSRYAKRGRKPDRQWVVESDALLFGEGGAAIHDVAQTSLDADIYSGEQPFAYIGDSDTLEAWTQRRGRLGDNFIPWKEKHGGRPLTALGWGSPSFDVFYPNCRGVFGFHDPVGTRDHRYRVIGWYGDLNDDYWLNYLRLRSGDWGLQDIDALTHLDAEHKRTLKRERVAKLLRDDLGVVLPAEDALSSEELVLAAQWERMVCCGEAQWLDAALLDPNDVLYAMGNSPTEALSALIAEKATHEQGRPARARLEDSLAAILMGDRLKSLKLDIGPKFREFRHADEFVGSDGGVQWVVEKVDDNPTKQPPGEYNQEQRPASPLPPSIFPLLNTLNTAQRAYDATARELESQQFQLYTDWYRYMHASYPPPGETEEYVEVSDLLAAIERGSLAAVKKLKWALGEAADGHATGLAAGIADAKAALEEALHRLNTEVKNDPTIVEQFHWEVQRRPAARFWEPASPALVVAIPRRGGAAGLVAENDAAADFGELSRADAALQPPLTCQLFSAPRASFDAGRFALNALLNADSITWTLPQTPLSTDLPIFRGEWQVEVFPVATMHSVTRSSGVYDPRFILTNYLLGENEPDVDDHPDLTSPLALAKAGSIYAGSTYVNQKLDDRYRGLLQRFRELQEARRKTLQGQAATFDAQASAASTADAAAQAGDDARAAAAQTRREMEELAATLANAEMAENFLDGHDLLVVTLNGFNAALLQRHTSIQLNPADPLGFAEYKAFAQDVAATLAGGLKGVSPDPHAAFMPIRSGGLRIMTLRLVDRFGRFTDLTPEDVVTALPMEVPGHGDWVRLPPRLAQPARWNFRFLQATQVATPGADPTESQSHRASSPVHGWIIPNLLDQSLDFFDPHGRRLGALRAIEEQSFWDGAALSTLPLRLRQIVEWLLAADQEVEPGQSSDDVHFLAEFIEDIEEALDNIHPDDREGQSAFSVLMGRPLAVVQFGVALELKGLPAVNNGWSALFDAIQNAQHVTDGFDEVQFYYRLGEYRQRNDGLVGCWGIEADGVLSAAFSVNDSVSAAIEQAAVQSLQGEYAERAQKDAAQAADVRQWIDLKNEEWQIYDPQGRTLFEFLLEEQDETVKKQDIIQPYVREGSRVWDMLVERGCLVEEVPFSRIRHYAEESQLSISAAEEMQQFVALLDPHGLVHLASGIQPVKTIQLPERFTKEALGRIEMEFLTAPVLTPERELHLALPKEQGFAWSWREANRWPANGAAQDSELSDQNGQPLATTEIAEQDIRPFQTVAFFPERFVLREGQLVLKHRTEQPTDDPKEH